MRRLGAAREDPDGGSEDGHDHDVYQRAGYDWPANWGGVVAGQARGVYGGAVVLWHGVAGCAGVSDSVEICAGWETGLGKGIEI